MPLRRAGARQVPARCSSGTPHLPKRYILERPVQVVATALIASQCTQLRNQDSQAAVILS